MYYVYKITCLVNGKVYIGQTSLTIEERFKQHEYSHRNEKYKKNILYAAMRKHGFSNFVVEKIDESETHQEIINKEIYWIGFYKSNHCKYPNIGYNMTDGGEGIIGFKLTPEQRRNLSESLKGRVWSEESKLKLSNSKMGHAVSKETIEKIKRTKADNPYKHSEESKENLRQKSTGKKHTKEAKEKISLSKIGKKRPPETIAKMSLFKKGQIPWNKGVPQTEEQRRKNSESKKGRLSWNKGVKMSDAARENMRNAQLGKKQTDVTKQNRKLTWLFNGLTKTINELNINITLPNDLFIYEEVVFYLLENIDSMKLNTQKANVTRKLKRMSVQIKELKEVLSI